MDEKELNKYVNGLNVDKLNKIQQAKCDLLGLRVWREPCRYGDCYVISDMGINRVVRTAKDNRAYFPNADEAIKVAANPEAHGLMWGINK